MSIVPSLTASIMARRSSSARSGGDSRKKVRYSPTSFSLSDKVVDRDAGGDLGAVGLGARNRGGGHRGRDLRGVVVAARQPGEHQVALQRDGLCLARNAWQAEPAGVEAFVHDAAAERSGSCVSCAITASKSRA